MGDSGDVGEIRDVGVRAEASSVKGFSSGAVIRTPTELVLDGARRRSGRSDDGSRWS